MKIIESNSVPEVELPLQLKVSFKKVFCLFEKYAQEEFINHPFHSSASNQHAPSFSNCFRICSPRR